MDNRASLTGSDIITKIIQKCSFTAKAASLPPDTESTDGQEQKTMTCGHHYRYCQAHNEKHFEAKAAHTWECGGKVGCNPPDVQDGVDRDCRERPTVGEME